MSKCYLTAWECVWGVGGWIKIKIASNHNAFTRSTPFSYILVRTSSCMCEDVNEILDLSSSSLGEQIFMKKYDDDDQRERWWWKKNFGTTLCACTMWGVLILVRKKSLKNSLCYTSKLCTYHTSHLSLSHPHSWK